MNETAFHDNVVPLFRWGVYVYPWGTAVKEQRTDKWTTICIGDQELDVTDRSIILHENGIEFVK